MVVVEDDDEEVVVVLEACEEAAADASVEVAVLLGCFSSGGVLVLLDFGTWLEQETESGRCSAIVGSFSSAGFAAELSPAGGFDKV